MNDPILEAVDNAIARRKREISILLARRKISSVNYMQSLAAMVKVRRRAELDAEIRREVTL